MPYRLQLKDAEESLELQEVAGCCPGTPQFTSLVNTVQRLYWRRGDWDNADWLVRMCIHDRCLVWPRFVRTVLGARFCCVGNAEIKNNWFAVIGTRNFCGWSCNVTMRDNGTMPVHRQPSAVMGGLISYHVTKNEDLGKTITLFGKSEGNQPLQDRDEGGNWRMGLTIPASNPNSQTTTVITGITSVVRECTQGPAYLFEYNPETGLRRQIAAYEPNETNPQYRCSFIQNFQQIKVVGSDDQYGRKNNQVEVMVKLAMIDAVCSSDFLFIDNIDALKLGMQAVKFGNQGDAISRKAFLNEGITELNFDLRETTPNNQTSIRVGSPGGLVVNPI